MVGAVVGYGFITKRIGATVVWVTGLSFLGTLLAPAIDAPLHVGALAGAAVGILVGLTGWCAVFILIGAYVGVSIGAPGGDIAGFVGLGFGGALGYLLYFLLKNWPVPPTSGEL